MNCVTYSCSDDNDAAKKYKNNFVLTDAIGMFINLQKFRNHLLENVERQQG